MLERTGNIPAQLSIAKSLMGHSDISLTAKIYTHTNEKAIQDVAKLINEETEEESGSLKKAAGGNPPQAQKVLEIYRKPIEEILSEDYIETDIKLKDHN